MHEFKKGFYKAAFNPVRKAQALSRLGKAQAKGYFGGPTWAHSPIAKYRAEAGSTAHKLRKITGAAAIGGTAAGVGVYNLTKDPDMKNVPQGDYGVGGPRYGV